MAISSYITALATVAPYVFLVGAKGTGKTLILELLEALCFNGRLTIPSRPSMYRMTEFYAATLLIDEVRRNIDPSALRVLKSGYKKSGVVTVTEGRIPRPYSTYGIKVFAGTKGYDDELLDRGIAVLCEKAAAGAGTARFDSSHFIKDEAFPLRNRLHCVALNNASRIHAALQSPELADNLQHREREIFLLPAVVCRVADEEDGGNRYQQLMAFAEENGSRKNLLASPGKMDAREIITATVDFIRGGCSEVPGHPQCFVAADVTSFIGKSINMPLLTSKRLGAELVKVGLLGTAKEDRPKFYLSSDKKSHQCWRLLPERVEGIANKYGVAL